MSDFESCLPSVRRDRLSPSKKEGTKPSSGPSDPTVAFSSPRSIALLLITEDGAVLGLDEETFSFSADPI